MELEIEKELSKNKKRAAGQVLAVVNPTTKQYDFVDVGELEIQGVKLKDLVLSFNELKKENKKLKRKTAFLLKSVKLLGGTK